MAGCKSKACFIHLNQSDLIALVYSVVIRFSECPYGTSCRILFLNWITLLHVFAESTPSSTSTKFQREEVYRDVLCNF